MIQTFRLIESAVIILSIHIPHTQLESLLMPLMSRERPHQYLIAVKQVNLTYLIRHYLEKADISFEFVTSHEEEIRFRVSNPIQTDKQFDWFLLKCAFLLLLVFIFCS
ncbi:MAG: hypothetical protein CME32_09910 [Gimesia sp.]|nr:hypothetical protein [Gimesia sp.]